MRLCSWAGKEGIDFSYYCVLLSVFPLQSQLLHWCWCIYSCIILPSYMNSTFSWLLNYGGVWELYFNDYDLFYESYAYVYPFFKVLPPHQLINPVTSLHSWGTETALLSQLTLLWPQYNNDNHCIITFLHNTLTIIFVMKVNHIHRLCFFHKS